MPSKAWTKFPMHLQTQMIALGVQFAPIVLTQLSYILCSSVPYEGQLVHFLPAHPVYSQNMTTPVAALDGVVNGCEFG